MSPMQGTSLNVFRRSDRRTLHLCPVYAVVELLIYQTDCANIITANKVNASGFFDGGLGVVRLADDSFRGTAQDLALLVSTRS